MALGLQRVYERSAEPMALVAELTTNAVTITDGRQRLVWVNEAFSRLTGYSAAEAHGRVVGRLLRSGRATSRRSTRTCGAS